MEDDSLEVLSNLSPTELALLELTNDGAEFAQEAGAGSEPVFISTKGVYPWGTVISLMLAADVTLDDRRFLDVLRQAVNDGKTKVREYYAKSDIFRPPFEEELFEEVLSSLSQTLGVPLKVDDIQRKTEAAYRSLVAQKLIEDPIPFLVAGALIAVVGLFPTNINIKTKKGKLKRFAYDSFFLKIEHDPAGAGGFSRTDISFRVWKIVKAFKRGFIGGFQEAIVGIEHDEEPRS